MRDSQTRWVLAFDASCATCREISEATGKACDGKLEVLSLASSHVQQWREIAMGPNAPWAPTLLRVREDGRIRGWTGAGMALALARHLGPGPTLAVLHALGAPRRAAAHSTDASALGVPEPASSGRGEMGRARFLQVAAGAVVVGGLILSGKTPAFADQRRAEAQAWAEARTGALPESYDEVVAHPMLYRKAIYRASPPAVRSCLWIEQLNRFRSTHPELSTAQSDALDSALALAADESIFRFQSPRPPTAHARLESLRRQTDQAFGDGAARDLLATLGAAQSTATTPDASVPGCNCSIQSDYCDSRCIGAPYCICGAYCCDCGTFWAYECNGQCTPISDCA